MGLRVRVKVRVLGFGLRFRVWGLGCVRIRVSGLGCYAIGGLPSSESLPEEEKPSTSDPALSTWLSGTWDCRCSLPKVSSVAALAPYADGILPGQGLPD